MASNSIALAAAQLSEAATPAAALPPIKALITLSGGRGSRGARMAALSAEGVAPEARYLECVEAALPPLMAALHTHAAHPELCAAAGMLLRNIASEPCLEACIDAGAVQAMVAALCEHSGVVDTVTWVSGALCNLSCCDAGRNKCFASGALPALVSALRLHPGAEAVCEKVCSALGNIVSNNVVMKNVCLDDGLAPTLVTVLQAHAGNANVCERACKVFSVLTGSNSQGKVVCMEAGAIPAIVAALSTHVGSADVAQVGCWAIANIAGSARCREACWEGGAVAAMTAALAAHPTDELIEEEAGRALLRLGAPGGRLLLATLPPAGLQERLASCLECWRAAPRRACPRVGEHSGPHQCPVCFEEEAEKEWLALKCGHVVHSTCMMAWAAQETRAARAGAALNPKTEANCPMGRCVATRVAWVPGEAEGEVEVRSPVVADM